MRTTAPEADRGGELRDMGTEFLFYPVAGGGVWNVKLKDL